MAFYGNGMFLDRILVIQIVYLGLGFIVIFLSLLNLHAIHMSVTWQNEHNAVHDARIVDNLGKYILNCSLVCMQPGTLVHLVQIVHLNDPQTWWDFA